MEGLYSDISCRSVSPRIVVTLSMHLDASVLESVVNESLVRFPQMDVRLSEDGGLIPLAMPFRLSEDNGHLFRISICHKTVCFDFHRSLADEHGMMAFVKSVLYRYIEVQGFRIANDGTVKSLSGNFFPAEGEDPMYKVENMHASRPVWYMDAKAFHPSSVEDETAEEDVVQVRIPVSKLKDGFVQMSKEPLTYLTPMLSHSVYELFRDEIPAGEYVVPSIRVNLRPCFPTASMRPFYTTVTLAYNRNLNDYPFGTVLMSQKKLLEAQLKTDALAYYAQRGGTDAESTYDIGFAGMMVLPDAMQRYVTDIYALNPSDGHCVSVSIIIFRGEIILSLSGKSSVRRVAENFLDVLADNGVSAYISDIFSFVPAVF